MMIENGFLSNFYSPWAEGGARDPEYLYRLKTNEYLHGGIRRPILDLQLWALRVARRAHRLAIIPRVVTSNMARLTCQLAAIAYFPLTEILGAKFQVDLAAIVS